ncbi:tRNA (adenosine(37)-N6)-threonylcarbamoyltransferase complex dimerization subunit type 1 TsaB [Aliibacillus thermotolerans]|uniref:tRNA (Adenosine(37)-N6)-threonylcarbamoyltransferase complex dimerization subunit type 1 TsaB n=1 Tax=Aliibacillus thermotolerans TaxID=1834418 RepID=A0ABW0U516_9BACI|nr:tRNA (adenosine(37)-N6)-threonylcarbamoyltransferase complex dimerization subunit type 1 TsaB [Aliibacillus thermotolerans]MDA3130459.1 tRNA (adenosine(37)-N6)-threonylcarbamoyltransferase complex dimerization subunit type 1 TsaB [Aliibacillus thermotolerans]
MKILAIDTSTHVMGVAAAEEDVLLGEYVTHFKKNHSLRLMPAIEQLLMELAIKPYQLNAIVVAKGPGSYTGVRIGVTTAKSMAWALGIPVYGISSLAQLAMNGSFFQGYISPFFDARRGQVYTGLYQFEQNQMNAVYEDRIIPLDEWLEMLKVKHTPVLFLSSQLSTHQEKIQKELGDLAVFPPMSLHIPKPSSLFTLLNDKKRHPSGNVHALVPSYAQLPEAEKNWLRVQKEGKPHE